MNRAWFTGKRLGLLLVVVLFLLYLLGVFVIDVSKEEALDSRYTQESERIREQAEALLDSKMKTTLSLALTLSQNEDLDALADSEETVRRKYEQYLETLRQKTPFQNVWIELTEAGRTTYRSWKEKPVASYERSGRECSEPTVFLDVNEDDLLISASVPLERTPLCRMLYVHTHFNSIARKLAQHGLETVVVAAEEPSQRVTHPFSGLFAGRLYVANADASKGQVERLARSGMPDSCIRGKFMISDGYLETAAALHGRDATMLGCMIVYKPFDAIESRDIMMKALLYKIILLIVLVGIGLGAAAYLAYVQRRQKEYYKEIIDASSNVIVITDGRHIIDVNKTFYRYMPKGIDSLEAFNERHKCICDFFSDEEGFLAAEMDGETWVEYVQRRPETRHIAKVVIDDSVYYFQVKAAKMKHSESLRFSVVFSDITREYLDELELERISLTDPLTHVWNRRYFDETIQKELERSKRYNHPVSLLMLDIDHFKQINDRYGHAMGDKVLVTLCETLVGMLRTHDSFCRIGGEEFAVILPHTACNEALNIAERMRKRALEIHVEKQIRFTISVGVCECTTSVSACYQRTDKALYAAKSLGRNRVERCHR